LARGLAFCNLKNSCADPTNNLRSPESAKTREVFCCTATDENTPPRPEAFNGSVKILLDTSSVICHTRPHAQILREDVVG
jgi:hypothetical protein